MSSEFSDPPGPDLSVVALFCFWRRRTNGRTYTMCETDDHLFGRGLVGHLYLLF